MSAQPIEPFDMGKLANFSGINDQLPHTFMNIKRGIHKRWSFIQCHLNPCLINIKAKRLAQCLTYLHTTQARIDFNYLKACIGYHELRMCETMTVADTFQDIFDPYRQCRIGCSIYSDR